MVDVPTADHHPSEWANMMRDCHHQQANAEEGDQEGDSREKQSAARPVWNPFMYQPAKLGEMKQGKHDRRNQCGEDE
jgi:hypothetical protein